MAPSLQSLCRDPNELLGAWSPREVSVLLNFQSYSLTGLCQQAGWRWAALKSNPTHTREKEREESTQFVCFLETRSEVTQAGQERSPTSDPPASTFLKYWDYGDTPARLVCTVLRIESRASCMLGSSLLS